MRFRDITPPLGCGGYGGDDESVTPPETFLEYSYHDTLMWSRLITCRRIAAPPVFSSHSYRASTIRRELCSSGVATRTK